MWVKWRGYQDPTPVPRAQLLQDTNHPDLFREIDEAVERYREEKRLEDDDDDELEPEDPEDSGDPSEPEQLTGRVPRIHRPPVRYNPSANNSKRCVLELSYSDSLYYESELHMELDRTEIELTEIDYCLPH